MTHPNTRAVEIVKMHPDDAYKGMLDWSDHEWQRLQRPPEVENLSFDQFMQTFEERQGELAALEWRYPAFADWLAKWDIRAETAQETLEPALAPYFPSYGVVNAGASSTIPLEGIIYLSVDPSSPRMGVDWLEVAPWNRGADRQLWQVGDLLMSQALRLFLEDKNRNIFCGVATTPEAAKFDNRIGLTRAPENQIYKFMPYSVFSLALERWSLPGFRPGFYYATRDQAEQILGKLEAR